MERPFPAYEGTEPYVFVCYAHDDAGQVYPEITRLREAGFNIWYDEGISPGSEWSEALAEHIQQCAFFLFFVTRRSVEREHCRREVSFALEERCTILPVQLEPTDVPPALKLSLSHRQAILRHEHAPQAYEKKLHRALEAAALGRSDAIEAPATLALGEWRLDVVNHRLSRDDEEQMLEPKDLSVLLHLVEAAPDLVSTEALLDRSWPGVVVGDNALHQVIGRLRRAFGDSARHPQYIETLPKRGYRLMVPVKAGGSNSPKMARNTLEAARNSVDLPPSRRPARVLVTLALVVIAVVSTTWMLSNLGEKGPAQRIASQAKKVAILPFRDLSPQQDLQWLADGVKIRLTQIIGTSSDHQVIPTPLVQRMIEANALEGVDLLLTGSLQQEFDKNRMIIELTDVESEEQIWIQEFVSDSDDLFESQQRMALRISRYFNASIENELVPQVPAAWTPYLKFLHFQFGGAFDQEIYWLEKTLQEDPAWSRGWMVLTTQLIRRAIILKNESWIERARIAADRACGHAEDPHCRTARADIALWVDGDFDRTERINRQTAMQSGWYFPYGILLLHSGLPEEAATLFKRMSEDDPFFPASWDWLSAAYGILGQERIALEYANEFARLVPEDSVVPDLYRGVITAKLGRIEQAKAIAERFVQVANRADNKSDYEVFTRFGSRLISAKINTTTKKWNAARQDAEHFVKQGQLSFAAAVYLEIGDPIARELFAEAASNAQFYRRSLALLTLYLDQEHRSHPAFSDFLASLGQSLTWKRELCKRLSDIGPPIGIRCTSSTEEELDIADLVD